MKLSSNFIFFHDSFGLKKTIDIFADAGFEGIDFNNDVKQYHDDTHSKAFYEEIKKYALDKGISFYQTHSPFLGHITDENNFNEHFNNTVKAMEYSSYLGAEMTVIHPIRHVDISDPAEHFDALYEYNMKFYKELIPYAEEYNVKIAIENIKGTITQKPIDLLNLLKDLNSEAFVVCYDVGHDNISGQNPSESIMKLGSTIACTHIHDNNGDGDHHTLPFYGNIDFEAVMKAFAKIGYEGNLNYEAGCFIKNLPDALKIDAAEFMVKTGNYLIDRFKFYKKVGFDN